ncbi:MAG: ester cyclase, partial [Actinomycetota bacterium]|nr:ester cyclase [Actinomycetota bacterium]
MATTAQPTSPQAVIGDYFEALTRHDLDAIAARWSPEGVAHIAGRPDAAGPDGVRAYWAELFAACPDLRFTVTQTVAEDDRVGVQWAAAGTFSGSGSFQGIEPTGARLELEGMDIFRLRDGLLVREDAYTDGATFARQIGMLPPQGSTTEQRMTRAFNGQARFRRRAISTDAERVADGVWLVRGGFPLKTMNVYLIEDEGGGVTLFDAGIKAMTNALASAGAARGGINRLVLGHSHGDHRGAAAALKVPTLCHPAERVDAEGDGGAHYFDHSKLGIPARWTMPRMLEWWDGGPVEIAGTLDENDDVSGFRVVHLPGHAPGQIALFREADRLALTSDCFYTLDPETGRKGPPRLPHRGFNLDSEQARDSMRKLAALEPAAAWAGHA